MDIYVWRPNDKNILSGMEIHEKFISNDQA